MRKLRKKYHILRDYGQYLKISLYLLILPIILKIIISLIIIHSLIKDRIKK